MNSKILNQVPRDYYDKGIKTNLFQWIWHTWKWYLVRSLLKDISVEILDVGCADGTLTAKIAESLPKSKVTGLDLYKSAINYAKKRYPHLDFVVADARKMPFKNSYFDTVICVETLEHIPDNQKVVKEIHRVLKRKGTLVIAQDTDSLVFNLIWGIWIKWKGRVWQGAHVNCMKPQEIRTLLKDTGFKIVKTKYSHFGLEVIFEAKKFKKTKGIR